jgi:tetrahydromethanopterin S-methyltransferase subunit G
MTPSVKTILTHFESVLRKNYGEDFKKKALEIRNLMKDADNYDEIDEALNDINEILKCYGVESIQDNDFYGYYCDIGILYVNTGETYDFTVLYDTRQERFLITSWGNIVESDEERFNV